jgi:hypothetical protein
MAEPYVPIGTLNTYNAILTSIEVVTDAAEPNADALETATNSALASRIIAENALAGKFNILLLVGA